MKIGATVFCLALLLGGCPKRQTSPNVVYVPASPSPSAQNSAPADSSGSMVLEQPAAAPEAKPTAAAQEETTEPKSSARARRRQAPTDTAPEAEPTPQTDTHEQPAAQVPALETRETPQQQSELRAKVLEMNQGVQARIARLEQIHGAKLDQNTLEGARVFLAQSQRALESGDLQRAYNLARKASLLVDGLEQKP